MELAPFYVNNPLYMLRSIIFSTVLVSLIQVGHAQTWDGSGGIIVDNTTINDFVIDIQDLSPEELSAEHGLTRVCFSINHSWVSDLDIRLISPDGTNLMLTATKGDDQDNYENTCFTMDASIHIVNGAAPFNGSFKPFSPLGNVNNGSSGIGKWILRIFDQYPADQGELLGWSLTFGEQAPVPFQFDSSSLPIVLLSTDNITIPNEPKIDGYIKVIDNGPGLSNRVTDTPVFESFMGIEVRGASSQSFPKKSFGFETRDEFGDDLETTLLGLPKEDDWIMYAPYTDKSMLRDALTYKLGNDLGMYAPRTVFCELFLNGDYHGVYCLEEKIKRDKNRVDIAKLNPADTIGDALTGGYIIKVDRDDGDGTYFVSDFTGTYNEEVRLVYEDPEGPDLHPLQQNYIQDFMRSFENSLFGDDFKDEILGYRKYIDVRSFVDFFLISELGHNVDAYRLSTFMYKDRDSRDSLLHMGPLWDFNLAYGNVNYCNSEQFHGWAFEDSGACGNTPNWWSRLQEDEYFRNKVRCRYEEIRTNILDQLVIYQYIDEQVSLFEIPQVRNYERWPILGTYVWPNYFIGQNYPEEIDYMKSWIAGRISWLDDNLPGECIQVSSHNLNPSLFFVSPNPATDIIQVTSSTQNEFSGALVISDLAGRVVIRQNVTHSCRINVSELPSGYYVVGIRLDSGEEWKEELIKM